MRFERNILAAAIFCGLCLISPATAAGLASGKLPPQNPDLPRPTEQTPGIASFITGHTRSIEHKTWDKDQHPVGIVVLFGGLKTRQAFLEVLPANSYWTEILGGLLTIGNSRGRVVEAADPANKKLWDQLASENAFFAERYEMKIDLVPINFDSLAQPASIDMVLMSKKIGQMMQAGNFEKILAAANKTLKPGGTLLVEDYRANTDKPQDMKAANSYIREDYAIATIEKAGFKLTDKNDTMLANMKDAKEKPAPNSDRFLLKFTK